MTELINDIETTIVGDVKNAKQAAEQQPVVVESARPKWLASLDQLIGPVTEAFGMAAFSFILVVFILLAKDDLRDRMLRLIGDTHLPSTTRAIDEATTRLSQYLLAQLVLNVAFGLAIALTFWLFGVKYALLWGFLAAVFRYVPYIGTWVGIIPPALFALATTEDWWLPMVVIGIYAALEIFCNNAIEPYLYGSRLGVSEVGLLVSAAFWSFLWGPIGLILSGPISDVPRRPRPARPAVPLLRGAVGDGAAARPGRGPVPAAHDPRHGRGGEAHREEQAGGNAQRRVRRRPHPGSGEREDGHPLRRVHPGGGRADDRDGPRGGAAVPGHGRSTRPPGRTPSAAPGWPSSRPATRRTNWPSKRSAGCCRGTSGTSTP